MEKKRKVDEKEKQSRKSDIGSSILINKSSQERKEEITRKSLDIEVLNQEKQIRSQYLTDYGRNSLAIDLSKMLKMFFLMDY